MDTPTISNRRKFIRTSATGAAAMLLGTGKLATPVNANDMRPDATVSDVKALFKKCGACSHTFFHLLNREYGYTNKAAEIASDPLAGGIMLGHQCGMLWGSVLAAGAEASRRYPDAGEAASSAITAATELMNSYKSRTGSVLCHEVIGCDLSRPFGMAKMMVKIIFQGGLSNSTCFKLADKWAPEAIKAANDGLSVRQSREPIQNCASVVIGKMGGTREEMITVAGLAGGMGLQGYACGALGAAIWMNTYNWCKKHPGEVPPRFNRENTRKIVDGFFAVTRKEAECQKITGKKFTTISDHSAYIACGGCTKLIDTLVSLSV